MSSRAPLLGLGGARPFFHQLIRQIAAPVVPNRLPLAPIH